jgi:predicted NUDIX family phosphoesterase
VTEHVYCVPAASLPKPQGEVLPLGRELYARLLVGGAFRPRAEAEADESWRQIIPYAAVAQGGKVLLVERLAGGSESRLHKELSIGLGGHINPEDMGLENMGNARDLIEAALNRELREELEIGAFFAEAVGLIHRSETPVERVHTGVLYRVRSAGPVRVRETTKLAGHMVLPEELEGLFERLEGWSQVAWRFLRETTQTAQG